MGRPPNVPAEVVLRRMRSVFREHGYEGATMEALAASTGLNKASLYHRFPDGKAGMAAAVLEDLRSWSVLHLLTPLTEPGDPRARLHAMTVALQELYAGGHEPCLIGLFSNGEPLQAFGEQLQESVSQLISKIGQVLLEAGVAADLAQERAEDAVVRIQGSLVVARVLGTTRPFERMLRVLPDELLAPPLQQRGPSPEPPSPSGK